MTPDLEQRLQDEIEWYSVEPSAVDAAELHETRDVLKDALAALRSESKRLDGLEDLLNDGTDATICPPGNHGGVAENWLVTIEFVHRQFRECQAATLRAAIDAALKEKP